VDEMTRKAAQQACHTLLRPIASLMLKCGMTWREFSDLSRLVFVEVAGSEYGIRGRPTNVSRVSILTGINRKEVRRQRELLKTVPEPLPGKTGDATRVLSGWYQDPAFVDLNGKPRLLTESGPGPSFEELCKRHGGDIPPSALLKELKRVGAVEDVGGGRLRVVRRYYMPVRFDGQWVLNAGSMMSDLGRSISHNLSADQQDPSRFIGRAANGQVDAAAMPEFRAFIEEQGQKFLENVDAWLTAHQAEPRAGGHRPPPRTVRLGVGVFVIQGDNQGQGS
jgi:hypothetical protein